VALKAIISAFQSTTFLSAFVSIYMASVCGFRKISSRDHRVVYFLGGLLCSLAILIERKSRRAELALYVMPRACDTLYTILKDRKWLVGLPFGVEVLFAFSMGSLLYCHQHEPETISPLFHKMLSVFISSDQKKKKEEAVEGAVTVATEAVEAVEYPTQDHE
jgi:hypothetical protein